MKTLALENYGVVEMNTLEMKEVDGGDDGGKIALFQILFWVAVIILIAL